MMTLASQIERDRDAKIATAIRSLLASPFLTAANDQVAFDIVRQHRGQLVQWFEANCGWRLEVEPRLGYARLTKTSDRPPDRPARRRRSTRAPFDRRRYSLLCLIAAELMPSPATTIGILADRITQASATDPDIPTFDSSRHDDRRAYVDALKLLEAWEVVTATDGSADSFLDHPTAKVLYRVDSTRLARLLGAPNPPSRLEDRSLSALAREPRYGAGSEERSDAAESQRNLWLRHSITRRIVDDPVLYYDDLTEAQLGYLHSPTGRRLIREAVAAAGMILEERAEGMLAVDPEGRATDDKFPAEGSVVKQAALLLLDGMQAAGPAGMARDAVADFFGRRLNAMPGWASTFQSAGGAARLAEEVTEMLSGFGLVAVEGNVVRCLPAAARYWVAPGQLVRSDQAEPMPLPMFGEPA
jgi:uncharacterized protein (TIGR02678 family)